MHVEVVEDQLVGLDEHRVHLLLGGDLKHVLQLDQNLVETMRFTKKSFHLELPVFVFCRTTVIPWQG